MNSKINPVPTGGFEMQALRGLQHHSTAIQYKMKINKYHIIYTHNFKQIHVSSRYKHLYVLIDVDCIDADRGWVTNKNKQAVTWCRRTDWLIWTELHLEDAHSPSGHLPDLLGCSKWKKKNMWICGYWSPPGFCSSQRYPLKDTESLLWFLIYADSHY